MDKVPELPPSDDDPPPFMRPRPAPARGASPDLVWLKVLHGSGFVRELALKAIVEPPRIPIFLAALLHSLNDHTPQVRTAASQCLARLAGLIPATLVAEAAPYVVRRQAEWRYLEDGAAIDALLARSDVRTLIGRTLMTGQAGWLPRFFRELLAFDIADDCLPALAVRASHPAIRARSIFVLTEGKVTGLMAHRGPWRDPLHNGERPVAVPFDVSPLILAGARDRTVVVRKAAAQGLVRLYRTVPDAATLLAAFDNEKNTAIKERLDFIRRKLAAG